MYEFLCDYITPKYQNNAELCYIDTDSFLFHIKTKDFYKDIADDGWKRYNTSNYKVERPLPIGMNKKVIGLMKDGLGWWKIITEFAEYSYLTDDDKNVKKAKEKKYLKKYLSLMIIKKDYLRMKSY